MLNISNMEEVSRILGMDPEDIDEWDLDDASNELDPESKEWDIIMDAYREACGKEFESYAQRQERKEKEEDHKILKGIKPVVIAASTLLSKVFGKKFEKFTSEIVTEDISDITLDEAMENVINDDSDKTEEEQAKDNTIAILKAIEVNNEMRKNHKLQWLGIKAIELVLVIGLVVVLIPCVIIKLISMLINVDTEK